MHRLFVSLVLVSLSNLLICDARQERAKKESPKAATDQPHSEERISPKLFSLLLKARAVSPELRSDALIRLATSNLTQASDLKLELLEEAFDYAGSSPFAVKKTQFTGTYADSPSGYLAQGYGLNLDAISLRCRVVGATSKIDQKRARELFSGIELKSHLQSATPCKELLIPDVRTYYERFLDLTKAFTAKEIEEGYKSQFIENRIYEMVSPVQIGPLAKALTALDLDLDSLSRFISPFSNKLKQISTGYRTLYASEIVFSVTESVNGLITLIEKRGIPSRVLADAYRDYVVKNAAQRVCADTYEGEGNLPSFVRRANYFVFGWKPITKEEVKPSGVDLAYEEAPFWSSPISRKLLDDLRRLRFKNEKGELFTDAERETQKWREQLDDVLKALADWKEDDERNEDAYLNERALAYRTLVEVAPNEPIRGEVLQAFLNFLESFNADKLDRIVLYWHIKAVLEQARTKDGKVRSEMVTRLSNSKNPVVQLNAALISEGV